MQLPKEMRHPHAEIFTLYISKGLCGRAALCKQFFPISEGWEVVNRSGGIINTSSRFQRKTLANNKMSILGSLFRVCELVITSKAASVILTDNSIKKSKKEISQIKIIMRHAHTVMCLVCITIHYLSTLELETVSLPCRI